MLVSVWVTVNPSQEGLLCFWDTLTVLAGLIARGGVASKSCPRLRQAETPPHARPRSGACARSSLLWLGPGCYRRVTLAACSPLGPSVTSNSTESPSLRER